MLIVSWFICGMLYFFLYSYLFSTMICKEKFKLDIKNVVFSAILVGIICLISSNKDLAYTRPYITHLFAFLLLFVSYHKSFGKTLIGLLYILLLVCFSEMICAIICLLFNTPASQLITNYLWYLGLNVLILIILWFVSRIKFINKIFDSIIKWYDEKKYKSLSFFVVAVLTINIFILYNNTFKVLNTSSLFLTNLFCIAVFIFVIGFFKEKSNNNKIIYEYDQLLDYIKTYEQLLDEKSKNQHEYKNQLSVIRMMVKNKKTVEYIDSLLENETEENLEIINKLKYIPKGGLKGLIYYKVETMRKKNLNIFVDISSELNDSKLWRKCDQHLQSISKILGVYLDNAIEACENSKEKYIIFEAFLEDKSIVFKISNTFSNEINMNKIDNEGYTTKGKGKGYGLSLVKDLIEKNDCLSQNRTINGIYYIQKLYIKK